MQLCASLVFRVIVRRGEREVVAVDRGSSLCRERFEQREGERTVGGGTARGPESNSSFVLLTLLEPQQNHVLAECVPLHRLPDPVPATRADSLSCPSPRRLALIVIAPSHSILLSPQPVSPVLPRPCRMSSADSSNARADVDSNLLGTGKVNKAAILGQQGGVWAQSQGYQVRPEIPQSSDEAITRPDAHPCPPRSSRPRSRAPSSPRSTTPRRPRRAASVPRGPSSSPSAPTTAACTARSRCVRALVSSSRFAHLASVQLSLTHSPVPLLAGGRHRVRQDDAGSARRRVRAPDRARRGDQDRRGAPPPPGPVELRRAGVADPDPSSHAPRRTSPIT